MFKVFLYYQAMKQSVNKAFFLVSDNYYLKTKGK